MFIRPETVIHIGAHFGQDRTSYINLGATKIIWGEGSDETAEILAKRYPEDRVIKRIFWDQPNEVIRFYNSNDSANSSAIKPLKEKGFQVSEAMTTTIDQEFGSQEFLRKNLMIVVDVQGAELLVLKGAKRTLRATKYLVIEIALKSQGYEVTPSEDELDSMLAEFGFIKSVHRKSHENSYKDQLYVKSQTLKCWIAFADTCTLKVRFVLHAVKFKHSPTSNHNCEICNATR
jgi:FkbM family methyltransferase